MSKVLVFAGSNSSTSINKQLASFAAGLLEHHDYQIVDLNDYELPLFGVDLEKEIGQPENALSFNKLLENCSAIIVSLAEHNGDYSTAFKNLLDWLSRIDRHTFKNKKMLLMSTSPGGRGGASVLEHAHSRFPRHSAQIVQVFSLPYFEQNFNAGKLTNQDYLNKLKKAVKAFEEELV